MKADALRRSIEAGEAWLWSRSRQSVWHEVATSGQVQRIQETRIDCDQVTVWPRDRMRGRTRYCRTDRSSRFYRRVETDPGGPTSALDSVASSWPQAPSSPLAAFRRKGERPNKAFAPVVTTGCTPSPGKEILDG
nr:phosphoribosyl-AMP cyclohydrolase [Methylobacterium variabile]